MTAPTQSYVPKSYSRVGAGSSVSFFQNVEPGSMGATIPVTSRLT